MIRTLFAIGALVAISVAACTGVQAQEAPPFHPAPNLGYTIRIGVASDGVAIPPTPAPTAVVLTPLERAGFWGEVTHYGEGFNGSPMGCPPYDPYRSGDISIVAVGPSRYGEWPCGTEFNIAGPGGVINAYRQDSCPGCSGTHLDLSESGMLSVCGYLGRCPVYIIARVPR